MYDTAYDTSSLYPIVHDLTEAEYSPSTFCAGGMCFSLQDLLVPSEEPRPLVSHVPQSPPSRRRLSPSGSSNSLNSLSSNSLNSLESHASEEKDESVCDVPPRPAHFHDAYVLTRQIYRGRYSMVWESIHRQSGLRYATKIFDRRMLSPTEDAAVFREATILEELGPGAGTISHIDIYQEPHHFYLVSEYAEGGSLQMRLVNVKSLPEHQVKDLARSLLQGLLSLHSQDICHRNLKPDNILLHYTGEWNQEEKTLIADFGTAVHIPYFDGTRGKLTGMCGSSFYAAPEVQNRLPYDTQADMWSLGVVLFVCLSGSLPFLDKSRRGLLRKITNAEYIFDPKDWSTVSRGARRFVWKLLKANPHERMTAEQALCDSWLSPPEPCVAVDAPIEWTLTEATRTRKVRFDDVLKPPSKKTKRHRFFSILRRTKLAVIEEDDESISSKTTSSSSTEHHFIEI